MMGVEQRTRARKSETGAVYSQARNELIIASERVNVLSRLHAFGC